MSTGKLASMLAIFGLLGILLLLCASIRVFWLYRNSRNGSLRWYIRTHYLKQISAIACLFCLAMAASYAILLETWSLLYLIVGFKIGTWWLRLIIDQRA